jgi:hypothetical protein
MINPQSFLSRALGVAPAASSSAPAASDQLVLELRYRTDRYRFDEGWAMRGEAVDLMGLKSLVEATYTRETIK